MEINRQALLEKWAPVIDMDGAASVKDHSRRGDLAVILENQEREMRKSSDAYGMISETAYAPANAGSSAGLNAVSTGGYSAASRSEEHTSELQSH